MPKCLIGWGLVAVSYVLTYFLAANGGALAVPEPMMPSLVAGVMVILPYMLAGIYARRTFEHAQKGAAWVSIIPMVLERVLLLTIGTYYVSKKLHSGWNIFTVVRFIQYKTPAFYFSMTYIVLGIVSVLISVMCASFVKAEAKTK